MADIFLSYAREDTDVARRLSRLFELEDWSCTWDPEIQLGTDFRVFMGKEIDSASVVVALWTSAARASQWVHWEVDRARSSRKLVELAVSADAVQPGPTTDGALLIPPRPQIPPIRDVITALVARVGGLRRRSDGWNSRIELRGWQNRAPKQPVIGWEWIHPGTGERRLVRRERWVDSPTVAYGTTIGNGWNFGYEDRFVPIGFLLVKKASYRVELPQPPGFWADRRARTPRVLQSVPFNVDGRVIELMRDAIYPDGGIDLGAGSLSG